jgi:D-3-phosphoglycerate dehydrogenase
MGPINILVLQPDNYSLDALALYGDLGQVYLGLNAGPDKNAVSVLVVRLSYNIDYKFLKSFPKLRWIISPTTGLNHIDLVTCEERNIQVLSLNDQLEAIQLITSTSELTIGLILSLLRNINAAHKDVVYHQRWDRDKFKSRQLSKLNLGVIGLGRVGSHVADYAHAFGMKVMAYDPYISEKIFNDNNVKQCDLTTLLEQSDIVSIHAKLNENNHHLLGLTELRKMREDAIIVNTARGALLDEAAAASQIEQGLLAGIAVDVLEYENTEMEWWESPLVKSAKAGYNILITPHIGGCTIDAMHLTEEIMARHAFKKIKENECTK